ncbi:F-box protein At5g07610-like [Hordeum vulgare subsp. vulgare]|uniref:F-box protein At5g07610-like n=1 Tax=Hordeum vulgare subsp. vulgare TaxID=112509 RepID=UPI001D1A3B67|nr:F-box protein At5g07610-like [Hordeum vulgare subsp. vulgare]
MGQRCLELPFRYTSLSGDRRRAPLGASFTFLSNHHLPVDLLDSCNGLLLCRSYYVSHAVAPFRYIVCNPATDKWAVLPNSDKDSRKVATTSLGFDPAASPHFHVFELVVEHNYSRDIELCGVAVYSSETGESGFTRTRHGTELLGTPPPRSFSMAFYFLVPLTLNIMIA